MIKVLNAKLLKSIISDAYFCVSMKENQEFSKKLIAWYLDNKRELPWRMTKDPYKIWLSEIMLQQTRVAQGLPYYLRFIEAFPDVRDLADASEEQILKLWQGLGYYSRARNLHHTARYVAYELNGNFPDNYSDLKKLKGVGDYTASAIASICFGEPTPVVDGNVYRVLSRFFGIETPINSSKGIKEFKRLAEILIDKQQPANFNQAAMEFGATQCKPQNPYCLHCPMNDGCLALQQNKVAMLPVKLKKQKVGQRYFNYIVFVSEDGKTLLRQRTQKGIWHKLYEFPLIETRALAAEDEVLQHEMLSGCTSVSLYNETPIVHKLSHQHLYTQFWIVKVKALPEKGIATHKVQDFAVPVLIANFVAAFDFK